MTSCNNLILTDLSQPHEIDKFVATCSTSSNKPIKLTSCNKSVAFVAVLVPEYLYLNYLSGRFVVSHLMAL